MTEPYGATGTSEEELKQGQCPVCGSGTFIGGPQGGLAVNVGCAECDSWWNLTVITEELLPDRVRGPAVVWVHGAISKPPEGTRRTEPGPLFEVAKPAPPLEPKPGDGGR